MRVDRSAERWSYFNKSCIMADRTAAAGPAAPAAAATPSLGMSAVQRFMISALVAWFASLYFRDGTVNITNQQPAVHTPAAAYLAPEFVH